MIQKICVKLFLIVSRMSIMLLNKTSQHTDSRVKCREIHLEMEMNTNQLQKGECAMTKFNAFGRKTHHLIIIWSFDHTHTVRVENNDF